LRQCEEMQKKLADLKQEFKNQIALKQGDLSRLNESTMQKHKSHASSNQINTLFSVRIVKKNKNNNIIFLYCRLTTMLLRITL
jgi:hypothetical protein